jgi:dihydroorotase
MTVTTLTIRRPDDWHVHLRDGEMLKGVLPYTARQFARAIVMPNLSPPMTDVAGVSAYRDRILGGATGGPGLHPADDLLPDRRHRPRRDPARPCVGRVYCRQALSRARYDEQRAWRDISRQYPLPVLEAMQDIGMPLLVHGEVTDHDVDIFDREAVFIERTMTTLVRDYPALKIVFEHITTAEAVDFVTASGPNIGATITPQHLHINRNAMFVGGIRPHAYCLPVAKREKHRLALRKAAVSGNPKFFLGTDSAPHAVSAKESACGCAGIFNAPYAIESYALVFDEEGALEKLEGFASEFGPRFYGLPLNDEMVTLEKALIDVPLSVDANGTPVSPFHAGETIGWKLLSA